ncbi:MAG TPA: type II CAAX endopeptidase family protein [Aggregatilineaceae bacterium]|nr:type II CAAX endopeptidase family protein [Aggregatilineaceae bacterium]
MKSFVCGTCLLELNRPPAMPGDDLAGGDSGTPAPAGEGKPPGGRHIHPHMLTVLAALFGLGMILAAWLWTGVIRERDLGAWFPSEHWRADLILGGLVGAGFALVAWKLLDYVSAFQRMEQMLTSVLDMDALRVYDVLLFGLLAGIPEEILFRGAMQAALGWGITSVLFGALHAVSPAYFAYATLAGLLLGGLAIWRGGLWTPIAAHVTIDTCMFILLLLRWRHAPCRG